MKTKNTSRMLLAGMFLVLFSLLPKLSSAQINPPFTIVNNLPCPVDVRWVIYDQSSSPCSVCTTGGATIPGTSAHTLNGSDFAGCNPPACDIEVIVYTIGGSSTGLPVSVTYSGGGMPPLPFIPGCTSPNAFMDCSNMVSHINP